MEKYFNQIKIRLFFFGMNEEELKGILECFNARLKSYDAGEMIIRQSDIITNLYLVLEGGVNIEKRYLLGKKNYYY